MHTHFASGTQAVASFLPIVILGTAWRLTWLHVGRSKSSFWRSIAGAALFQY